MLQFENWRQTKNCLYKIIINDKETICDIRSDIYKHYTRIVLAALFWQLPMLVHAQVVDQTPGR